MYYLIDRSLVDIQEKLGKLGLRSFALHLQTLLTSNYQFASYSLFPKTSRGNMFRMCRIGIISYTQLMNLSDEMSRAEYS